MKRIDIHVVIGGREKISLSVSSSKLSYLLSPNVRSCLLPLQIRDASQHYLDKPLQNLDSSKAAATAAA